MTTDGKNVTVVWRRRDGSTVSTTAAAGTSLLRVAHQYGIELEGACEGVCACSTCHVILPGNVYKTLPDASEDEEDMLDQAFGLTPTSRLGCQVVLDPSLEGMTIVVPKATRNMAVDGYVAKPH
jgi:ferredoxin